MSNRVGAVDFVAYVSGVITPAVNGIKDDGELAVWLNRQLDEWELEAERPEGLPHAARVVQHLTTLLCNLRARIVDKIAAAERVLEGWAA